jgi:hypothetical protein
MDPNFFGAPRTGVHAYRLFDIAVVDLGLTLATAYGWTQYTGTPFVQTATFLLVSGVLAHWAVGVNTAGNVMLLGRV